MRRYMSLLEERGLLRRVDTPLRARRGDTEMQALMALLQRKSGPGLLLTGVEGINTRDVPILFNPFGSHERTALMLGAQSWGEARDKYVNVAADPSQWHRPALFTGHEAPCQEVVIQDVDLRRDIPHVWFGKEGASFVTGAVVITRDPETGERNAGWYRLTSFVDASHPRGGEYSEARAKKFLAGFFWWNPPMSGIGRHIAKAVRLGKRLEVACAVLCSPAVHIAATTTLAHGVDELEFAGGLEGRPIELVQCKTVDVQVPADAEWVIEGHIDPHEQEYVGWHSNWIGYYDEAHLLPLMEVSCITRRKDAIWYSTVEMMPPFDHVYLGVMTVEVELLKDLQARIPEVKDVATTPNFSFVIQLSVDGAKKPFPGFGRHVLHAVWGAGGRWARSAKMVIVVGPDVDPRDWGAIEWAIMTRVQPVSDIIMNASGPAQLLDPSLPKNAQGAGSLSEQFGIDATIKVPERHDSYPEVSIADEAQIGNLAERLSKILAG